MVIWQRIRGSRAIRAVGLEDLGTASGLGPWRVHIAFTRGKTYVYAVGDRQYYDQFIAAASRGRFYVFVIKQRFDYVSKY